MPFAICNAEFAVVHAAQDICGCCLLFGMLKYFRLQDISCRVLFVILNIEVVVVHKMYEYYAFAICNAECFVIVNTYGYGYALCHI